MGKNSTSIVNKLVTNFLITHENDDARDLVSEWNDKTMQQRLKVSLKKNKVSRPKGIKGTYLHFCASERPVIIRERPGVPIKEITVELGRRWKEFKESRDPKDVARMSEYVALYNADRERYLREKEAVIPSKTTKRKGQIDTMYKAFCAERRRSSPANKQPTIVQLNAEWRELKKDPVAMSRLNDRLVMS